MPDIEPNEYPERKIGSCPKYFKKDFKTYEDYLDHILNC